MTDFYRPYVAQWNTDTRQFYPDFIQFNLTEDEYITYWNRLTRSKYLKTNGNQVVPTNRFNYAFQYIKGWFGYPNECEPDAIKLTLHKLAYYGYVAGYNQDELKEMAHHPLDAVYAARVSEKRNDEATLFLQHHLIDSYTASSLYTVSYQYDKSTYMDSLGAQDNRYNFGSSYAGLRWWNEIPRLDPQDEDLINLTVQNLKIRNSQKINYSFIPSSRFAKKAALDYMNSAEIEDMPIVTSFFNLLLRTETTAEKKIQHDYLDRALQLDAQCYLQNIPLFVRSYVMRDQYAEAFAIIEQMDNLDHASDHLMKYFDEAHRIEFLKKGSNLAKMVAVKFLKQNKASAAAKYIDNIDDYAPAQAFNLFMDEKNPDKAFEVFNKNQEKGQFDKKRCQTLADHFVVVADQLYEEGRKNREKAESSKTDWAKIKELYLNSLKAMKKAFLLTSTENEQELLFTHQRLYAQILIDADIAVNSPEHSDLVQIKHALKLLAECKSEDKEETLLLRRAEVKGLMREADHLTHLIRVGDLYERDVKLRLAHHTQHQANFARIEQIYKRVIGLLKGTKNKEQRLILAKAHFMLGDMALFFDLPHIEKTKHFKEAVAAAPENPYYLLRGSEHYESKKESWQIKGLQLMEEMDRSASSHFMMWDEYRWHVKGSGSGTVFDIHHRDDSVPEGAWANIRARF